MTFKQPVHVKSPTPKREKRVKAWATCFSLNKKCMESGNPSYFYTRKQAMEYLEKTYGKWQAKNDFHLVPCTISYSLPSPRKSKKKKK